MDNIALLDLLCSFRTFAAQSPAELVRPKVEDAGPLAIVQVRRRPTGGPAAAVPEGLGWELLLWMPVANAGW